MYRSGEIRSRTSTHARSWVRRAAVSAPLAVAVVALALSGCAQERNRQATLALIDSVLTELGGVPASVMNRTQRWRMVSSLGPGLPPPGFAREDLPDSESRGAALLQVHCQGCHWMPTPQMHSATEWPLLLRRMLLRAVTLGDRMGGPLTTELIGSELQMEGMKWSYMPSAEDADSLLNYLQGHALPVAAPGEIGEGPDAELFVQTCTICHETPSPRAHAPAEWEQVLARMNANMPMMGIEPMTDEERARILLFLKARAAL